MRAYSPSTFSKKNALDHVTFRDLLKKSSSNHVEKAFTFTPESQSRGSVTFNKKKISTPFIGPTVYLNSGLGTENEKQKNSNKNIFFNRPSSADKQTKDNNSSSKKKQINNGILDGKTNLKKSATERNLISSSNKVNKNKNNVIYDFKNKIFLTEENSDDNNENTLNDFKIELEDKNESIQADNKNKKVIKKKNHIDSKTKNNNNDKYNLQRKKKDLSKNLNEINIQNKQHILLNSNCVNSINNNSLNNVDNTSKQKCINGKFTYNNIKTKAILMNISENNNSNAHSNNKILNTEPTKQSENKFVAETKLKNKKPKASVKFSENTNNKTNITLKKIRKQPRPSKSSKTINPNIDPLKEMKDQIKEILEESNNKLTNISMQCSQIDIDEELSYSRAQDEYAQELDDAYNEKLRKITEINDKYDYDLYEMKDALDKDDEGNVNNVIYNLLKGDKEEELGNVEIDFQLKKNYAKMNYLSKIELIKEKNKLERQNMYENGILDEMKEKIDKILNTHMIKDKTNDKKKDTNHKNVSNNNVISNNSKSKTEDFSEIHNEVSAEN